MPTCRDHRLRPAGITGEKEVSRKKKESLRKTVREPEGGIPFPGFMDASRAHACDLQHDVGFTVISSYFTLSRLHLLLPGISVAKDVRADEQTFPFIKRPSVG